MNEKIGIQGETSPSLDGSETENYVMRRLIPRIRHGTLGSIFAILMAIPSTASAEGKVHALLCFDTDAGGGIGRGVKSDRDNLLRVLWESFDTDERRNRIEMTVLEGAKLIPSRILDWYADLVSDDDDTLLFYYSGHGGMDRDGGHFLAMSHGTVWRSDLRAAMLSRKPRLCIILTDCCANFEDQIPQQGELPVPTPANWDVVQLLFFNSSGFVDTNAAAPGSFSYANDQGGLWTNGIATHLGSPVERLDLDADGNVTWGEFLGVVDGYVANYISKDRQFAYVFSARRFNEKRLKIVNDSDYTLKIYVRTQYFDPDADEWKWWTPNLYWTAKPGETIYPVEKQDGFEVRGCRMNIWAETFDGTRIWNKYKSDYWELIDPRWGNYYDTEMRYAVQRFGN
jgi:hypothetical protein